MTIPASELAAWSELAEKAHLPWIRDERMRHTTTEFVESLGRLWPVYDDFGNVDGEQPSFVCNCGEQPEIADYVTAAANALPRLIAAYSQSQARVAELEKAIRDHQDLRSHGASGKDDRALWSVLPQSEGSRDE